MSTMEEKIFEYFDGTKDKVFSKRHIKRLAKKFIKYSDNPKVPESKVDMSLMKLVSHSLNSDVWNEIVIHALLENYPVAAKIIEAEPFTNQSAIMHDNEHGTVSFLMYQGKIRKVLMGDKKNHNFGHFYVWSELKKDLRNAFVKRADNG